MLEQFSRFRRELSLQGVESSHSGDIGVGACGRIFTTHRGSMLSDLAEGIRTIPVIGAGLTEGSDEAAERLPPLLENYRAAVVRGHGSFAVGRMLEGALRWTSSLGASCKTLYLYRLLSPGDKEEGRGKW